MTNTAFESAHPRAAIGTFADKAQTQPGITLTYTAEDIARAELRAFAAERGLAVGAVYGASEVRNLLSYELDMNEADLSVRERATVVDETIADSRFASIPVQFGDAADAEIHALLREKIRDHGGAGEQRGVIEPAADLAAVIDLLKANGCASYATSASMAGGEQAAAHVLDADIFSLHRDWNGRNSDWERVSRWILRELHGR